MKDEDFFKDLDVYANKTIEILKNKLNGFWSNVLTIDVLYEVPLSILEKYELNSDITFFLKITPKKIQSKYLYKKMEVKPEAYYMRPENYNPVSTLETLREAIKQDTPYPNIKNIENKNNLTTV